ncbi:unnamed protein product [Triticum turgidum subsp. durum]|uniref:Uncharacterized protein n=1 Tax=Triticum turgidum subsp. durum TaxID=4567 RepID=A0A9R0XAX8_TRITD|nr:unnamed protein product [Triticum turgidum subsp. durum]
MSRPPRHGKSNGGAERAAAAAIPLHRHVVLALDAHGALISHYSTSNLPRRSKDDVAQVVAVTADCIPSLSKSKIEEHEQKVNGYQAELAARIKAKYFSNKAFDGGKIFEEETIVEGETIRSSRWPCTSSYADPVNFLREKNSHEKRDSPSVVAEASPKNNEGVLATENNLTPGKREASKET